MFKKEIQDQINAIDDECVYYPAEVMALAGAFIYLNNSELNVRLGFAKKEDTLEQAAEIICKL